jgi:hypothetical protein
MTKRQAPLIGSIVFLLSSLALWNQANHYFATSTSAPPPQVAVVETAKSCWEAPARRCPYQGEIPSAQIEGVWEQYSIHEGQREFMARLDVRSDNGDYVATPLVISEFCFPKHAYRSYDHAESDGVWTFREAWDNNEVGEFALVRQPNGEYRGYARSAGSECGFETVYVRVAD